MSDRYLLWREGRAQADIILPDPATPIERDAAEELRRFLCLASEAEWQCVPEGSRQRSGIFVGRTKFAAERQLLSGTLPDEAYLLWCDPSQRAVVLCGVSDMATAYAVYDFLHRFVDARWYLPTDLFQVVPKRRDLALPAFRTLQSPAFSPRTFGYVWMGEKCSYTGERHPVFGCDRWAVRNRLSVDRRGTPQYHSHNLYRIVSPQKYGQSHPEYFPLRRGRRYVPTNPMDQDWQPCLTNPDVVRLAVEAGREFFRQNPREWQWFSLGINDGYGWCECDRCRAVNGSPPPFRGREVQSEVYYRFVEQVASQLKQEFPDRKMGLIAYLSVEKPPQRIARLPDNVVVVITQETAQHHDRTYREEDVRFVKEWLAKANGQVYRYDYHGLTWVMPRYFPTLVAEDARRMRELGLKGYYTEDVPTWSTMGPLLYLTARLWWNPSENERTILTEFSRNLFGRAAEPMQKVFAVYERIWMRPRQGRFFAGLSGPADQVHLYTSDDLRSINHLFEQALRLADSEPASQRVRFFEQGWRLAEFYLKEHLASAQLARGDTDSGLQLLQLLAEHERFYQRFRQQDGLLSGTVRWMLEELGREGAWRTSLKQKAISMLVNLTTGQVQTQEGRDTIRRMRLFARQTADEPLQRLIDTLIRWQELPPAPNVLRNPELQAEDAEWKESTPGEWGFWRAASGTPEHRKGSVRITGIADDACFLQAQPVSAGEAVLARARYRLKAGTSAVVYLRCRWRIETGWFPAGGGGEQDLLSEASCSTPEGTLTVFGIVPDGVSQALLLLGVRNLNAGEWVEFTEPYLARRRV